jgi:hypothetical protein
MGSIFFTEQRRKGLRMGHKFRIFLLAFVLLNTAKSHAQVETAVPFLIIPNSPEGNGMGGIAASLISDNAISTISNPAQLGIFSLNDFFNASTYTPKTPWANGISLDATALNAGINLKKYLDLPTPISFGVGYSRVYFDLGNVNYTSPDNPQTIAAEHEYEKSDNLSFGIGIDYKVKLGLGYSSKWINSKLRSAFTYAVEGTRHRENSFTPHTVRVSS